MGKKGLLFYNASPMGVSRIANVARMSDHVSFSIHDRCKSN